MVSCLFTSICRLQITAVLRTVKFIVLSSTYILLMLIFVYVDYYLEIIYITNLYNNLKDLLMVFFCVCLIRDLSPLFSFGEKIRKLIV